MSTYNYKPGLGLVGAYQVSGIPYVKGPISNAPANGGPYKVTFPQVTRWVKVINYAQTGSNEEVLISFSAKGLENQTHAMSVLPSSEIHLDLKVTELYYTGSSESFSVIAGLTYIQTDQINNISVSPSGSNWSGSLNANVG